MRGNPQTPAPASPPRQRSGGTRPWRRLGIVFWRGAPEPAVPSWKKLEQAGKRAAAGPCTLEGQGQEKPCPGRLASGRDKTLRLWQRETRVGTIRFRRALGAWRRPAPCLCQHQEEGNGRVGALGGGKGDLTLVIDSARHCAGRWGSRYHTVVVVPALESLQSTLLSYKKSPHIERDPDAGKD